MIPIKVEKALDKNRRAHKRLNDILDKCLGPEASEEEVLETLRLSTWSTNMLVNALEIRNSGN